MATLDFVELGTEYARLVLAAEGKIEGPRNAEREREIERIFIAAKEPLQAYVENLLEEIETK